MNNENSTSDPFERRPFGEQDEPSYQAYRDSGGNTGGDTATFNTGHTSGLGGANSAQTPSSGTPFYGDYPGVPSSGHSGQRGASYPDSTGNSAYPNNPAYPSSASGQFQNGHPAYSGPWAGPANGGTVPPTGVPEQDHRREKRRWSTALLGLTAAFSMLFGGVVGTQLDTLFGWDSTPSQSSQPRQIPQAPQVDPDNSQNIPGQQSSPSSGLDAGTVVESAPGIVLVNTHLYYGDGAGTGMILTSDGLMITNYHVVSGSEEVQITISDTGETYTAQVLGHDATHDIALLQIDDAKNLDTVKTNTKQLKIGDEVSAVGNGSGQGYLTQLDGSVIALDETITATDAASPTDGEVLTGLIVTDADVVPGYSGGPLFNSDGEVVGVTTAASRGVTSDQVNGFAVPIATALDIADQIKSGKPSDTVRIGRNPALGVTVANGTTSGGARIVEVLEGSAADQAGIVPDDTVIALDGTAITTSGMLSGLVKEYEVGDVVTLTVIGADGMQREVQVTLAESTVN